MFMKGGEKMEDEKLDRLVQTKVTKRQYERLRFIAKQRGITISQWIRNLINNILNLSENHKEF